MPMQDFCLEDIMPTMVVKYRNGKFAYVNRHWMLALETEDTRHLGKYTHDLLRSDGKDDYIIDAVYKPFRSGLGLLKLLSPDDMEGIKTLLWERGAVVSPILNVDTTGYPAVGIEILNRIAEKGITKKVAAGIIGIAPRTLNFIINGRFSISPLSAEKLTSLFTDTTADYWLHYGE